MLKKRFQKITKLIKLKITNNLGLNNKIFN